MLETLQLWLIMRLMKKKPDKNQVQIEALGRRIAMLREQINISQELLGAYAEKSTNCISAIECGKSNPSFSTLVDVAKGLKMDLYKIIADAQYQPLILPDKIKPIVSKLKALDDKQLEKISKLIDLFYLEKN